MCQICGSISANYKVEGNYSEIYERKISNSFMEENFQYTITRLMVMHSTSINNRVVI